MNTYHCLKLKGNTWYFIQLKCYILFLKIYRKYVCLSYKLLDQFFFCFLQSNLFLSTVYCTASSLFTWNVKLGHFYCANKFHVISFFYLFKSESRSQQWSTIFKWVRIAHRVAFERWRLWNYRINIYIFSILPTSAWDNKLIQYLWDFNLYHSA